MNDKENETLNSEIVLKVITHNPLDYRIVLNKMFLAHKTGIERKVVYSKLNNIISSLRNKGLAPTGKRYKKKLKTRRTKGRGLAKIIEDQRKAIKALESPSSRRDTMMKTQLFEPSTLGVLLSLSKYSNPQREVEIVKAMHLSEREMNEKLSILLSRGLVSRTEDGMYLVTKAGLEEVKKFKPFDNPFETTSEDNFLYHIPMLIEHAGEKFNAENIVQRAYSYQGFYEKIGVTEQEAFEDFRKKIREHLEGEALRRPFIRHERHYQYRAIPDDDKFLLWRLYCMLHTILFKSGKSRKLGGAIWIYEPLLNLLKKNRKMISDKISLLPKDEQYIIMLLLDGVQLETILPRSKVQGFRQKLELCNIPYTVYNRGTDNETTIVEQRTSDEKRITLSDFRDSISNAGFKAGLNG